MDGGFSSVSKFISLAEAQARLENNETIGVMTDTVAGLACIINPIALEKLYALKQRPFDKPCVWMVNSIDQIRDLVKINKFAEYLIKTFWPGALTLILPINKIKVKNKKEDKLSNEFRVWQDYCSFFKLKTNCSLDCLGVRVPNQLVLLKLLHNLKQPLAVTSANISGREKNDFLGCPILEVNAQNRNVGTQPSTILKVGMQESDIQFIRKGELYNQISKKIIYS